VGAGVHTYLALFPPLTTHVPITVADGASRVPALRVLTGWEWTSGWTLSRYLLSVALSLQPLASVSHTLHRLLTDRASLIRHLTSSPTLGTLLTSHSHLCVLAMHC
jgi:hypothetical protein